MALQYTGIQVSRTYLFDKVKGITAYQIEANTLALLKDTLPFARDDEGFPLINLPLELFIRVRFNRRDCP